MQPAELEALVRRYAEGPALLRAAWGRVPSAARAWRPGPGTWSPHEVVIHCADSETNSHGRLRYLLAEKKPVIVGYDQDLWATALDYAHHPVEPALATVEAVRANTVPLLRRLSPADWAKSGIHTESGTYSVAQWMKTYAEHLEIHAAQLDRLTKAFATAP